MDFLNVQNDILQTEIDRLEDEITSLTSIKRPYKIKTRLNPMVVYGDEEFRRRFRLKKTAVQCLYTLIGPQLEPLASRQDFTISGLDKILITLRYYATASFHLICSEFYGISESSVCNIVPIVSEKIASLRTIFIKMPSTDNEIEKNKRAFFRVAGMPMVIGAMDGTLIKIQEVGGQQNKTDFFCRKQFYAINTQIVCDAQAKVMDIVARWPGSTHDETVFVNSAIFNRFLNGEFNRNGRNSLLLADGGYGSEPFLALPLRQVNRARSRAEEMYQRSHISTRNVVERFNGQWKKRFPCLWIGMRFRKLETVLNVIVATAVLHNICKLYNDDMPPQLTPDVNIAYNLAITQMEQPGGNERQNDNLPGRIVNEMLRNYFENIAAQ